MNFCIYDVPVNGFLLSNQKYLFKGILNQELYQSAIPTILINSAAFSESIMKKVFLQNSRLTRN